MMIVICLFCSQLYDLTPKAPVVDDGTDNTTIDVEAFKVLMSLIVHVICTVCLVICLMANNIATCAKSLPPIVIVTILLFNLIFNIGGCVCLWIHNAPQFPGGYSRAVLAAAVMSSISAGYNLCVVLLFCCQYPVATQETVLAKTAGGVSPAATKQGEGRKQRAYERKEAKKDEVKVNRKSWREPSPIAPVIKSPPGEPQENPQEKEQQSGHSGVVPVMEGSAGSAPPLPPPPSAPPAASSVDRTQPTNREIEPEGGESRQKFGQELGSKERDIIAVTDHRSAGDVKTAIEILDRPAIAN